MYKVDVYLRVRRAVMVEGMSMREAARVFGLHRDTVRKMLAYSVPPGYRRQSPPRKPKLEPYTGVIDRILEDDLRRPRKQRHTAKRIFERFRDEYGFDGGYTTVKDYVRENRRQTKEMFVPLSHAPGHAQCDFVLLGEDANSNPTKLESFRLAASAADFDKELQHPRSFANKAAPALAEYLGRALSYRAALAEPRDLARLLASYARDGLARIEASGDAPSLNAVRSALEEALGVKFEGARGAAFFRSTLVQTLFYGIFSAWVLWARQTSAPKGPFDWHDSAKLLRVPVIRELFWQLSNPGQLQPLGLNEALDWTAAALDLEEGHFLTSRTARRFLRNSDPNGHNRREFFLALGQVLIDMGFVPDFEPHLPVQVSSAEAYGDVVQLARRRWDAFMSTIPWPFMGQGRFSLTAR